jgi:hypothetical protein
MFEFVIDAINLSETVVLARALETRQVTDGEQRYLRVIASITESVKGGFGRDATIVIDINHEGKETPRIQLGNEYLFFLTPNGAERRRVLAETRPIAIRADERERFLTHLRAAAELASATPLETELKRHYLAMLRSGIRFFVTDAAKACSTLPSWTDGELRQVIDIVEGKGVVERPQGNDHDHLAAVVVHHGSVPLATQFAREELKQGHGDAVYFGLLTRNNQTDAIVTDLLRDPDEAVRKEALRVAGLLRKNELLDAFERELPTEESGVLQALQAARALTARD